MNQRFTLLLHVAIWATLFLAPLSFMYHGNGISLWQYLMGCTGTLAMMVVFYSNYLWLTPHYYVQGNHRVYWTVNTVMCLCFAVGVHVWMSFYHHHFDDGHQPHHQPTLWQHGLFVLRELFNMAVAAAIATLAQLSLRWHKSEDARLEAEAARTDAELRNLRNQINPHFLLNTLNNIYALTAFDAQRAQTAIEQLSQMLRHMLYEHTGEARLQSSHPLATVPLDEEVQFLRNYVALMKIRLSGNVDVVFDVERNATDTQVAPLLFISLVENAFKHGISPTEPSFIHIRLTDTEEELVCDIENSNHPKNKDDRSGHGIGLSQVQRRLDLSYPGNYTWTRGVSDDGRTYRSTIRIHNLQTLN